MAIQLPNPGLGDGQTGDNEFVMWTKVKDNFSNTTHAANRLVGIATGNVMEVGAFGLGPVTLESSSFKTNLGVTGFGKWNTGTFDGVSSVSYGFSVSYAASGGGAHQFGIVVNRSDNQVYLVQNNWGTNAVAKIYTSLNTTKDSNGFIKASSPVLRVFSDHIEGNGDGEAMGAKFVKKGVGNYLIKGTTGLADEGWYVTVPQDANGNNLVAVEYESLENGDVSLKTYKRKFDFETVSIVADHDSPLDIPETRWIDLRFNEIEKDEVANEPIE